MTVISELEAKRSGGNPASQVREISIAHSPDSDDAFMFYGLATSKVRVPGLRFTHTLCDIETLNQKAREGSLRCDCDFVSCLSLYSGFVRADVVRRQRGRGLWADDRFAAPVHAS